MIRHRPMRLDRGETLPEQDDSRPNVTSSSPSSYMLNNCTDCGKYKWVYLLDPRDGKGLRYICGRCKRAVEGR